MATTSRRKNKPAYFPEEHETKEWWQETQEHVTENAWQYAIGVGIVVIAAIAGGLYNAHLKSRDAHAATAYAEAMQEEDPAVRLEELAALKDLQGAARPRILYMLGEAAFAQGEYNRAEEAFSALEKEFPNHTLTPRGVEGLGFAALAREDYDAAAGYFEEVRTKWPTSPEALRQSLNLGKVHEAQEDFEAAAASYEEQQTVFPDSAAAASAQTALARLKKAHPGAFGLPTPTPPEPLEQAAAGGPASEEAETLVVQPDVEALKAEIGALEAEVEALPEPVEASVDTGVNGAALTLPSSPSVPEDPAMRAAPAEEAEPVDVEGEAETAPSAE